MFRSWLQKFANGFGYYLARLPRRRFDDTETALRTLGTFDRVIDCGANAGQWSLMAKEIFPAATFVLIEPQEQYRETLSALCSQNKWQYHRALLTDRAASLMVVGGGTGLEVSCSGEGRPCEGVTLDALLGENRGRTLLKLDVEGHELHVLRGATTVLTSVDAILAEVAFYDIEHAGHLQFTELLNYLANAGFVLYDFASLSGRLRDHRLRQGDAIFVRSRSALARDDSWD